ncbi:MAG: group III truncated hemoglobin [Planctomycetes bacterium]|nr:group III truncated hemoglobin [Planctomycetota bacterium]
MIQDIETRSDIEQFMNAFYVTVLADQELAVKFAAVDLEEHKSHIVDFWQSTIIGGVSYTASPFAAHRSLDLAERHFQLWLAYFEDTLNAMFSGPRTEQCKQKAHHVANMFRFKLGLLD